MQLTASISCRQLSGTAVYQDRTGSDRRTSVGSGAVVITVTPAAVMSSTAGRMTAGTVTAGTARSGGCLMRSTGAGQRATLSCTGPSTKTLSPRKSSASQAHPSTAGDVFSSSTAGGNRAGAVSGLGGARPGPVPAHGGSSVAARSAGGTGPVEGSGEGRGEGEGEEMRLAGPQGVVGTGHHKRPPQIFYSKKGERFLFQAGETMQIHELPEGTRVIYPGVRNDGTNNPDEMRRMVLEALSNPVGQPPLREKLKKLKAEKENPKILMSFDDVSIPLPPMRSPDIRRIILEEAERMCVEEGISDITFVCSIALHRYIRPDEFRHICGPHLFNKYHPQRMMNYNAVDKTDSVHIGYTRHGEDVEVNKYFASADLVVYANCNYVAMDGGYKSYATGLVHYNCLKHNHDSKTLRKTRSLYDPPNSEMHKSFYRVGRMMQKHTDVFHVETVLDERLFPFYIGFIDVLLKDMNILQKVLAYATVFSLKLVPLWLRMPIFWATRGPFGLLQVTAGETQAVHERTLDCCYRDKIVDVQGQADILILAPTCLGPYTKDMYFNPLLVNTYAMGYWFNMYVDGTPLVKEGGVVIIVNEMHYKWSSPGHDQYKEFFERVVAKAPGLDEFEAFQEEFVNNERLNDNYRNGYGPASVHGFYMYTWAAHGMDKVSKVFVVGATDKRGPEILRWEMAPTITEAVEQARTFLKNPKAEATYFRCPPLGYMRVHKDEKE